jgi:hypothetical protein
VKHYKVVTSQDTVFWGGSLNPEGFEQSLNTAAGDERLICRCVCQVGHGGGARVCGFLVGMGGGVSALGLSRRAVEADMRGFGYPHDRVCVGSWPHL